MKTSQDSLALPALAGAAGGVAALSRPPNLRVPALVSILLLTIQVYALLRGFDDRNVDRLMNRPQVATYVEGRKDVWSKTAGSLSWKAPARGEILLREDEIATMSDSEALLQFSDGALINVEPNSLVVLERSPSSERGGLRKIALRLIRGGMKISRTAQAGVEIAYRGPENIFQKVSVEDGADGKSVVSVRREGIDAVKVQVEQGNVKLNGLRAIGADEEALVRAPSQINVQPVPPAKLPAPKIRKLRIETQEGGEGAMYRAIPAPLRLAGFLRAVIHYVLSPAAFAKTGERPKVIALMEWEKVEGAAAYEIQISTSKDFAKPEVREKFEQPKYRFETSAGKKSIRWYFRVAAIDASGVVGEFSDIESFLVAAAKPNESPSVPRTILVRQGKAPEVVKLTPTPTPSPTPTAKPTPSPTSTPSPTPQPPLFNNGLRGDVRVGADYHHRSFKNPDVFPKTFSAGGLVPGSLGVDVRKRKESGLSLGGGFSLIPEKITPTTTNVATEKAGVPFLQIWLAAGKERNGRLHSIGAYVTNQYAAEFVGRRIDTTVRWNFGLMFEIEKPPSATRIWGWRARLAGFGPDWGGDGWLGVRIMVPYTRLYKIERGAGFFLEPDASARFSTRETAYGGGVRLGYAF